MKRSYVIFPAALLAAPLFAAELAPSREQTAAIATPSHEAPAASTIAVARAQFTSTIDNREPADQIAHIGTDQTGIYFFTELKGLEGQTITHRWEHKGQVKFEQSFYVTAPRFRTYSNKTLDPAQTGEWKASVVDAQGKTLAASTFTYGEAPAATAQGAAPAAPAR